MHVAHQTTLERVDGVVVQNAVMALVAGGQQLFSLCRNAGHVLALVYAMGHQLFGEHVLAGLEGLDGHLVVQVQWQGDDHPFDVLVGQQFFVVVVNLDVLASFVLGLPTVLLHQAHAQAAAFGLDWSPWNARKML